MLADLAHGKLVNLKPESVEHEFVNTNYRHADRTTFEVDERLWDSSMDSARQVKSAVIAVLRDFGTGLDVALYEDIISHLLGGDPAVLRNIEIFSRGRALLGLHPVRLADTRMNFGITAVPERDRTRIEDYLQRFLDHTDLVGTHWINSRHNRVTFQTIHRNS